MDKLTVTFYDKGFSTKPTSQIGAIQNYFKANKNAPAQLNTDQFVRMLKEGFPHLVVNYGGENSVDKSTWFRSNLFCYDVDHLEGYTKHQRIELEAKLKRLFHVVQRSMSWKEQAPRYHCYLILDKPVEVYDRAKSLYVFYRGELEKYLGIEFDKSIHMFKPIFAGQKKGLIYNENLRRYKADIVIPTEETIEYNNKKHANSNINVDRLKECANECGAISDYQDWITFIMGIKHTVYQGKISEDEAMQILDLVDDGSGGYKKKWRTFSGEGKVTIGSVVHLLEEYGVDTRGIFEYVAKVQKADKVIRFDGYLSECGEAEGIYREACTSPGKKTLIVAPTGSGKSFLLQKTMTDINEQYKTGLRILAIPRIRLVDNFTIEFESDGKSFATIGSDTSEGKREAVQTFNKILTTIDHAPVIVSNKEELLETGEKHLLVTDEAHMLVQDSSFKDYAVTKYLNDAEKVIQNKGGAIVHITATPQYLDYENYDTVIEFERTKKSTPFVNLTSHTIMSKDINTLGDTIELHEKDTKMSPLFIETLLQSIKANPNKCHLAFIENRNLIAKTKELLEAEGVKVVSVTSKDKDLDNMQSQLINDGLIPNGVQAILATTTLSAGVSITNNHHNDETWILVSEDSMNSDSITIVQMANRFRKQYDNLRLFLTNNKGQDKNAFQFDWVKADELRKGENTLAYASNCDTGILPYELSEFERNSGVYLHDGNLMLSHEKIVSEVIQRKKRIYLHSPHLLIGELEQYYGVECINHCLETATMDIDLEEEVDEEERLVYKDCLLSDDKVYSSLVRLAGDSPYYEELKMMLPRNAVREIMYLANNEYSFKDMASIMRVVLDSAGSYKTSFKDDYEGVMELSRLRVHGELWKEVVRTLVDNSFVGMEFKNKREIDDYVQATIDNQYKDTNLKGKDLMKYFEVKRKSKKVDGKVKKVTQIISTINNDTLQNKYGITFKR